MKSMKYDVRVGWPDHLPVTVRRKGKAADRGYGGRVGWPV